MVAGETKTEDGTWKGLAFLDKTGRGILPVSSGGLVDVADLSSTGAHCGDSYISCDPACIPNYQLPRCLGRRL
jgi:hypothetical protein